MGTYRVRIIFLKNILFFYEKVFVQKKKAAVVADPTLANKFSRKNAEKTIDLNAQEGP